MRGTAFIVSRKGANDNALKAARGALRESGKLIICLSLDDKFDMLEQLNPVHFFGGRSRRRSKDSSSPRSSRGEKVVVRGCFRKFSARVRHANIAKALRKRSGFNIEAQHLPLICPTGKSAPLLIFRSPAPLAKIFPLTRRANQF
jgi:hypothetical protein